MRTSRTYIPALRYLVQAVFLLLTIFIGWQFEQFVQHFAFPEHPFVERPASVDAFLPIGGFMAFKFFLLTGIVDPVHPAGFILFVAILGVSLAMKKGFCGWICPVGTLSQYAWMAGEKIFNRNFRINAFADASLRSLKYVLLSLFVLLIGLAMAPTMIAFFFISDYYKVVDVRMLRFFTNMSLITMGVLLALVVSSVLYKNFWCRYLCPYGALLGLVSRFSPFKIRRNEEKCVHCHACTQHCPTLVDVENKTVVKSAECFGCLTCVSHCPAEGALDLTFKLGGKSSIVKPWLYPIILLVLFYLVIGIGMATDKWKSKIPYEEYQRLIPDVRKEYVKH
jgi:polyferredoxin